MLDEKAREKRNLYLREWRKKNKDKVKKYNESYWERRANKEEDMKDVRNIREL
ncbi:hypothetical protein [Clostridium perfringens]|uniref:Uncharacterized protein n=2 Tax=Clostridium perfringens TaxID=1502 RepID=A0AAP6WPP4_CLOPF|nr:hypothetical protein [Clostridium perfringens]EDT23626.1 hypothetical protein AC1_0046 [Clostridium perfringens B str. ATCC 3626]MCX0366276.1 hypothetical protein [Clostridium perfringens]NGU31424.1 hypothetical protein [Clostridium perfringens]WEV06884.1 hypothetical protein PL322_00210 [Clostridium perfringens B]